MDAPSIGKLITDGNRLRDAIHVAIAPVEAAEALWPGERVGLVHGSVDRVQRTVESIGIVDPYLDRFVNPGERFYLFLYPNTVTSLRHVWTHPAFQPKGPA